MKILYVGYRDDRHSLNGGYDHITENPGSNYIDSKNLPFGKIPVGKKGKKLNLLCLDIKARKLSKKYDIIHYFYSDFMLFRNCPKKYAERFIATVHMKSEDLSDKSIQILQTFRNVICLSSNEEYKLKKMGIKAIFIPHGFNKPQYIENENILVDNLKINIFFSGSNYRDYETLFYVLKKINRDDLFFYCLGQKSDIKEKLREFKNVIIVPRVDDNTYYSLLAKCDYNFLPLTFATANNAMLEAQSFGKISILPEIDGISDYACSDNIFYNSKKICIGIFDRLKKESLIEKETKVYEWSKRFEWKAVYEKLEQVYKN